MAKIYQVDAFTDRLFGGNPAAVVPLESWIDDKTLQLVAMENNLAETAFFVPVETGYELRWFTPASEVALCGHATLATAHVLVNHLGVESERLDFITRKSGTLSVTKEPDGRLSMSFPVIDVNESTDHHLVANALGAEPQALLKGNYTEAEFDYMAVFDSAQSVSSISSNKAEFKKLKSRGVIVTAAVDATVDSSSADFVSRYFAPNYGIDEDPVTGSAHCLLAPYWSSVLGKSELIAHQVSERSGVIACRLQGDRTVLTGSCVDYLQGDINLA